MGFSLAPLRLQRMLPGPLRLPVQLRAGPQGSPGHSRLPLHPLGPVQPLAFNASE